MVEEASGTVSSKIDVKEGNVLYSAGDFLGAAQKYSQGLKICTENNIDRRVLLKNRAAAYLKLGEYQKAVDDTTAALEITPNDVRCLHRRCKAYEQLGKYNEAFEDARAVNRLNPKSSSIQPLLRRLQKMKPVIVEERSGTFSSETSSSGNLDLNEGNTSYSAGDFQGAIDKYSKSLRLCTDNNTDRAILLKNRAAAYLKVKEYQKVIDDTTAALEITPNDVRALYRRCQAYDQLKMYNEAFEDAKAVNCLNPQNSAIQPYLRKLQEIIKSNEEVCNINSLPNEMLINIFSFLSQNELVKIARVCTRWNELTSYPLLWKHVSVMFHKIHGSPNTVAKCFVKTLPPCVTHIQLDFLKYDYRTEKLDFKELSLGLQGRCPHLKAFILWNVKLSECLPLVIDLCTQFLQDVKTLVFHYCRFGDYSADRELGDSKIETLCVTRCSLIRDIYETFMGQFRKLELAKLPHLSVLDMSGSRIGYKPFEAIGNHGLNLKKLYLCFTSVTDDYLNFISLLPHLEIICLFDCGSVRSDDIVSIIKSCQSLQKVYVDLDREEYLAAHPFFVLNRCKFEIVKLRCHRYHAD